MKKLSRGYAWLDTGTHESLLDASMFIRILDTRQGIKVGCPEGAAWDNGWINADELEKLAEPLEKSGYGKYLKELLLR